MREIPVIPRPLVTFQTMWELGSFDFGKKKRTLGVGELQGQGAAGGPEQRVVRVVNAGVGEGRCVSMGVYTLWQSLWPERLGREPCCWLWVGQSQLVN